MEPEVHIIEKWFQEVLHCFTMTNIQLKGKKEIDLLAINPRNSHRYHIESRVSTTFKLREKATYTKDGKCHKNGLDYFSKEKFDHPTVREKIRELFGSDDYTRILVIWNTQDDFEVIPEKALDKYRIHLMSLKSIINGFTNKQVTSGSRDDVLRVLELVSLIQKEKSREKKRESKTVSS